MSALKCSAASPAVVSSETRCVHVVPSPGDHDKSALKNKSVDNLPSPEKPLKDNSEDLPRLHVVTVTTHEDGYFTSLVYSSLLLQSGLRVLGWGEKWKGFGMKPVKLVEYCRQLPPRDVVMLVDGFDSVLLQPNEVIIRKFLEFGGRVVLTGECRTNSFLSSVFLMFHNCVFKCAEMKWPKRLPYAHKDVNVRLLNAGGMIGYAEDLIELCKDVQYTWNDQRYLSEVFMKNPHKLVTIDANCSIFSLYRSRKQFKVLTYAEAQKEARHVVPYFPDDPVWNEEAAQKRRPAPSFQKSALRGVLMNVVTHETPCVLHMYCRSNANHLVEALGLPKAEKIMNPWSLIWYAYFSLRGTLLNVSNGKTHWHTSYVTAFLSAVFAGVGTVGLLLNALIYLSSLAVPRAIVYTLQQRAKGLLGPLMLSRMKTDLPGTAEAVVQAPVVHSSSWALALQLFIHLCLIPAPTLSRVGGVLVTLTVWLLPVFVALAFTGFVTLGMFVYLHGNYGDDDEAPMPADAADLSSPIRKHTTKKR